MTARSTRLMGWIGFIGIVLLPYSILVKSSQAAPSNLLDPKIFEWRFYLQNNADLLNSGYRTRKQAEEHWQQNGVREGRQAHPGFHSRQYLQKYADIRSTYGANNYSRAIDHYLVNGYREGRVGYVTSGAFERWTVKNDRIYVGASSRTAGAIDSIVWNNREFVNSYDHGRQVQVALNKNNLSECYNPTQAGSLDDSIGFATTSKLEAIRAADDTLMAQTLAAFWLAPNQKGQFCTGGGINTTKQSNYRINTAIKVGYAGLPHAIQFRSSILVPDVANHIVTEMPAIYVAGDFTSFYTYDFASKKAIPFPTVPSLGEQKEISQVIILATSDGRYAISTWSPELPQAGYEPWQYAYGNLLPGSGVDATTNLRATFRAGTPNAPIAAGTSLHYRTFIVVGSLNDVKVTLQQLYTRSKAGTLP
jgi:hypothetical protein